MSKSLTSSSVSKSIGVNLKTLQGWVRDGKINVDTEGTGPGRRIRWTEEAVEQARRLRDKVAGDSKLATAIGPDVASALALAKKAQAVQSDSDVVVATPDSARVFRDDSSLREVMKRIRGRVAVIIGR